MLAQDVNISLKEYNFLVVMMSSLTLTLTVSLMVDPVVNNIAGKEKQGESRTEIKFHRLVPLSITFDLSIFVRLNVNMEQDS